MKLIETYNRVSLIVRILCGLALGIVLGVCVKSLAVVPLLGSVFVGALKAVAPVLVFVLVVSALAQGSYIGILFWAVVFGLASKSLASDGTKRAMEDIANAVSQIVRWIINLAPFGIMGLVYTNVATNGLAIFKDYGRLLLLLVGCMLATALIVDPLIAAVVLRRNPYPLVFRCLKESGVTALNSSGDVMFAATAEYAQWQKQGKPLPRFLGGTLETRV